MGSVKSAPLTPSVRPSHSRWCLVGACCSAPPPHRRLASSTPPHPPGTTMVSAPRDPPSSPPFLPRVGLPRRVGVSGSGTDLSLSLPHNAAGGVGDGSRRPRKPVAWFLVCSCTGGWMLDGSRGTGPPAPVPDPWARPVAGAAPVSMAIPLPRLVLVSSAGDRGDSRFRPIGFWAWFHCLHPLAENTRGLRLPILLSTKNACHQQLCLGTSYKLHAVQNR